MYMSIISKDDCDLHMYLRVVKDKKLNHKNNSPERSSVILLTVLLELVVDTLEDRCELLAGGAPAGAEVDSQHLTLQSLRGHLGAVSLRTEANEKNMST